MIDIKMKASDVKTVHKRLKSVSGRVSLTIHDNVPALVAQNSDVLVRQRLPGYVDHNDIAVELPLDVLEFFSSRVKKGEVEILSSDGIKFTLRAGTKSIQYTGEEASSMKDCLPINPLSIENAGYNFLTLVSLVLPTVATDKSKRRAFRGLHVNKTRMEATNGVVLTYVPYESPENLQRTLIPIPPLRWAIQHLPQGDIVVKQYDKKRFGLTPSIPSGWLDDVEVFFTAMSEEYPDIEVIRPSTKIRASIPYAALANSLKDAQFFGKKQKEDHVDLIFTESGLTVQYKPDNNELAPIFQESIPITFDGEPCTIRFNVDILVTMFDKQWPNKIPNIEFTGSEDEPCKFSCSEFTPVHIIMPMKRI